jgi:YcxB-like protein
MALDGTVELSCAPTKRDVFRAGLLVWREHFRWRYRIAIAICAFPGIFAVLMNIIAPAAERSVLYGLDLAIALPFLIYLFPHTILFLVTRTMFRDNPRLAEPTRYTFSASGVVAESYAGRSELKWTVYRRIRETSEYFLLYTSPRVAGPLPKRCFSSENDIQLFRELVRSSVNGTVELRS